MSDFALKFEHVSKSYQLQRGLRQMIALEVSAARITLTRLS